MLFDENDKEKLEKIKVKNILDLALILPSSYEDLSLSSKPNPSCFNTTEIEIYSSSSSYSLLKIHAFSPSWQSYVQITIFHPKAFHFALYKAGKKLFIYGKCETYLENYNFVNPKIVQNVGKINFKFKQKIKDEEILKLKEKYINEKNLLNFGLTAKEAKNLMIFNQVSKEAIEKIFALNEKDEKFLKFLEIFSYLKKLRAKKSDFPARKLELFPIETWLNSLPFSLTQDQKEAIKDIQEDLKKEKASKRVIMGDVGSGKSIIMFAAALLLYPKSAILMAPTSVLAQQLYEEALRLLPNFMKIKLLKSGEKNPDLENYNFIISTHALLYQTLPKANLIMIDEQHKFGTNAREKIKNLSKDENFHPHFLQFSATPIPRTLSLIEASLVDFSFLKTLPFEKNIKTYNIQSQDFPNLLKHIKKVLAENLQVAIIYPLIEESEKAQYQSLKQAAPFWERNFSNVYKISSQDKNKDEIMKEFDEKGEILLATTVLEVGISLNRLNTIIIVGAEKFGLSSLHQLRGRVGRKGGKAFCFLFTKMQEIPQRLKEFAKTQDGFKVANLDLKNRQSGDLLEGKIQHGKAFTFYNYEEDITELAKKRLEKIPKK